jgi:spore germination cell wall hydrolase CwlJ-like protein
MKVIKYVFLLLLLIAVELSPSGIENLSSQSKLLQEQYIVFSKQQEENRQLHCLRQALWFEARGESEQGIRAVASVILNRTTSGVYPSEICSVVRQYKQFSFTHELSSFVIKPVGKENKTLLSINKIIQEVKTKKFNRNLPSGVLWYHTTSVKPYWSKKKKTVKVIGKHIFKQKHKVKSNEKSN